jgi:membrane protease YdiL (CAAX protease family)
MPPICLLGVYILGVLLGAGLLAPVLYLGIEPISQAIPALRPLAEYPFHRYVSRSLMIVALIGLWPLCRALSIRRAVDLGLPPPRPHIGALLSGFAVGWATLGVVAILMILGGARSLDLTHSLSDWILVPLEVAAAAWIIGLVEEALFRGGLFGGLSRRMAWPWALGVSSVVFGLVHFLERPPALEEVRWYSGLALIPRMMRGFGDLEMLIPSFPNLALSGVILGLAYQRSGNLYFSIGLHAGWVFWLKLFRLLTDHASGANAWFWGSGRMLDGWQTTFILLGLLAAMQVRSIRVPGPRPSTGEPA